MAAATDESFMDTGDLRAMAELEEFMGKTFGEGQVTWVANNQLEISSFNFKFPRARKQQLAT